MRKVIDATAAGIPMPHGAPSSAQIQATIAGSAYMSWPTFLPVLHVPFFETEMYKRVNLDVAPSEKCCGSDLPLHDITTLRFFFNLGVQQSRAVLLSQHIALLHNASHHHSQPLPNPAATIASLLLLQQLTSNETNKTPSLIDQLLHQGAYKSSGELEDASSAAAAPEIGDTSDASTMQIELTQRIHRAALQQQHRMQQNTMTSIARDISVGTAASDDRTPIRPTSRQNDRFDTNNCRTYHASFDVPGFFPLKPKQQAAIHRRHQEMAETAAAAAYRPSSSGSLRSDLFRTMCQEPSITSRSPDHRHIATTWIGLSKGLPGDCCSTLVSSDDAKSASSSSSSSDCVEGPSKTSTTLSPCAEVRTSSNHDRPALGPMLMVSYLNACLGKTNSSNNPDSVSVPTDEAIEIGCFSPHVIARATIDLPSHSDNAVVGVHSPSKRPLTDARSSPNSKRFMILDDDISQSPLL